LYDEATGVNGTGYEFYAQNDVQLLLVPGDYQYATDDARLPSKPFKVVAGKQTDFDADFDDWMARVNLSYEDTEGFPDATLAPELLCFDADGKNQGHLATSRWTNQLVMLDAKTTSCSIVVAGTLQSFTLSPGQTASIALGRLNVDDVELTDEGGQKVKGSFNVQRWNGTAWSAPLLAKPAGTYAGLDLPKDRYQVTIDYQVATGHKTQVFTVDL
jgi:hypothetical protein